MRDADSGVGRIDVLAAFSAGPIGVDTKIVGFDIDDDRVVDFRRNKHACETGVATLGLVERRNANEPMHTRFPTQKPKREVSGLSLIHISEPTRQAEISYAVFC